MQQYAISIVNTRNRNQAGKIALLLTCTRLSLSVMEIRPVMKPKQKYSILCKQKKSLQKWSLDQR